MSVIFPITFVLSSGFLTKKYIDAIKNQIIEVIKRIKLFEFPVSKLFQ